MGVVIHDQATNDYPGANVLPAPWNISVEHSQLCHGASTCVPRCVCGTFPRCIPHVDLVPCLAMFELHLVSLPSDGILLANTKSLTLFDTMIIFEAKPIAPISKPVDHRRLCALAC